MGKVTCLEADRLVYSVQEAAKLLGINAITVYNLARTENFPALRIGRRIVIPKAALERWLDGNF
ncbi:MAG: hypothetical protein DDT21_00351 [Syntrophomonadaceae bacterium]|nr:hypothetical protein [Bacillota bacterium]